MSSEEIKLFLCSFVYKEFVNGRDIDYVSCVKILREQQLETDIISTSYKYKPISISCSNDYYWQTYMHFRNTHSYMKTTVELFLWLFANETWTATKNIIFYSRWRFVFVSYMNRFEIFSAIVKEVSFKIEQKLRTKIVQMLRQNRKRTAKIVKTKRKRRKSTT